ncbi:MAG: type II secretion system GspH family protein [Proteobacteria bacterium]|nr:type II secretion system GspH family protein [Pseudomonadota bacterium]
MCLSGRATPPKLARRQSLGFTLLELIVIITVGGLLAALVVNLMGTQLLRSSSPSTISADAGDAEAALEGVVALYTANVNNGISGALDAVKAEYPASNSTATHVTIVDDATWGTPTSPTGLRALIVTATVGNTSYTTLLTQARTNALDNATNF